MPTLPLNFCVVGKKYINIRVGLEEGKTQLCTGYMDQLVSRLGVLEQSDLAG